MTDPAGPDTPGTEASGAEAFRPPTPDPTGDDCPRPVPSLPERPDPDQLRRRARELQRGARAGDPAALQLLRRQLGTRLPEPLPLHLAQLALARAHGFPGWPRLMAQVQSVVERRCDPLAVLQTPTTNPAEELLRSAVLLFGPPDGPSRWSRAARLLADQPELVRARVEVAAAAADPAALADHLAADPAAVSRPGGPFDWPPLLYLAYSRLALAGWAGDAPAALQVLLDAGADPDVGFLWQGLPTPFTALTGVLGGATGSAQPPHPDGRRLATMLLDAGADPNDGQLLYNKMFDPDDQHLELLLRHGLGRGDGGPWRRLLPELTDSPDELLASQLGWAVVHGFERRIRLLARAGVELGRPLAARLPTALGLTPVALARRSGRPEVVRLLQELGAPDDGPDDESRLVEALLTGDRAAAQVLIRADPVAVDRLRERQPSLVLRAAVADQLDGVRLLVEHGFAVDALGRQDLPLEEPWETALHHAAGEGKHELAELLLDLGADPSTRDQRFDATPLGWAEHVGQQQLVELLEPVTPPSGGGPDHEQRP